MLFNDPIYGKENLKEKVFEEIISNEAFQRLKDISQHGLPQRYWFVKGFSRYEHSLGVTIVLRKFGATLEEQLAGLLHDISHSAFSHVADWVFKEKRVRNGVEDYQDNQTLSYLNKYTNLPKITKSYGFNIDRLVETKRFSLLEKSIPDICADRFDYCLRELYYNKSKVLAKDIWKNAFNMNGNLVLRNKNFASAIAYEFLSMQSEHWGSKENNKRYFEFANILKKALNKKIISRNILYLEGEKEILKRIAKDKELKKRLNKFKEKTLPFPDQGKTVQKKFRYIDPLYYKNGKLVRLSDESSAFKKKLEFDRKLNQKGIVV